MNVLLIKTSSLGDLVHCFPAITDASKEIPGIRFDWVVEEAYTEVPAWHPRVDRVIPVSLRRWRKALFDKATHRQWRQFVAQVRDREYDLVIDAQGLLKSAFLIRQARGIKVGFDANSARESLASLFYTRKIPVPRGEHAINRQRRLFAAALGYSVHGSEGVFGLELDSPGISGQERPYLVFLHGTSWLSKQFPETGWLQLAERADQLGFDVLLPWGDDAERQRAERIAEAGDWVRMVPRTGLNELAGILRRASGVVSVDTGLAHIACALERPQVVLYGPTSTALTGVMGGSQRNLGVTIGCAPCLKRRCSLPSSHAGEPVCFDQLQVDEIMEKLNEVMDRKSAQK